LNTTNKEVALIGKGAGRELAPIKGTKGIDTWGVNDIVAHRECDVCFFMDRHLLLGGNMDTLVKNAVNHTNTPLYCTKTFEDIPTSIEYPLNEVICHFGLDYFSDSCAYMLALAIYNGYEKIHLYGFNYSHGSKYIIEKPCVSAWLGVALGKGIKLNIQERSELLKTVDGNRYAYQEIQASLDHTACLPFVTKGGKMKFGIRERISGIGILPVTGSYKQLKMANRLRKEFMFNEKDAKKINLREVTFQNRPMMLWDENVDFEEKEIEISPEETEMIRDSLHVMDSEGRLFHEHIGLYEMFCEE